MVRQIPQFLKDRLSIEEEVGFAYFLVYDEKPLEETRKQVEQTCKTLRQAQEERKQTPYHLKPSFSWSYQKQLRQMAGFRDAYSQFVAPRPSL